MPSEKPRIYLASNSPRRHEILANLGFHITHLPASIDETPQPNENARAYVIRMAQEKNIAAQNQWQQTHSSSPDAPILTADTIVTLQGDILGKPQSTDHAAQMLRQLSGQTHQVLSAVCLFSDGIMHQTIQSNEVRFKTLTEPEIQAYLATGEANDKAGAYGIQGIAAIFIEHLQGSFTGVMGLPVFETHQLLQKAGISCL